MRKEILMRNLKVGKEIISQQHIGRGDTARP